MVEIEISVVLMLHQEYGCHDQAQKMISQATPGKQDSHLPISRRTSSCFARSLVLTLRAISHNREKVAPLGKRHDLEGRKIGIRKALERWRLSLKKSIF